MCELLPNKRIRITIPFHHLLFPGIAIPFPNGMAILRTKRGFIIWIVVFLFVSSILLSFKMLYSPGIGNILLKGSPFGCIFLHTMCVWLLVICI